MASRSTRNICNPLIRQGLDLCRLYRHAAKAVREPGLRAVLDEDAQALAAVVCEWQDVVMRSGGEPLRQGSWRAALRCRLVDGMSRLETRRDYAWILALTRDEAGLLQRCERAIAQLPAEAARPLQQQLPRLRGIDLDMHSLAGSLRL